jgi:acyl-CoA dehydrogenase
MPSIYFREEHDLLRDQLRRFVENEIAPHAEAWEAKGEIPRQLFRDMGRLGFLGLRYPEAYGGGALDTLASVVLAEELGRSTVGGVGAAVLVHTDMASPHLVRYGSAEQIARWLPGIVAGEILTAVAVTEPNAGSDVAAIRTRARRKGDHFVLDGRKMFITNGASADLLFVAARTDADAKGSRAISMIALERGTPGFSVGRKLEKHGWRSSDTAELVFEDCRVPVANLLGRENAGFYSIMKNFQNERVVLAAQAMGEAAKALELTRDYVQERSAFGKPLWDKQRVRLRLAELSAKVEAGRQLVYHAAWLDAQGRDAVREVSMAKAYCGELVNEVMYACVQFHGGMGYMRESAIERMARDARIQSIGGGASEVMLEEIAKRMR